MDLDSRTSEGATPAESGGRSAQENDTNTTIFIGNLPFTINEEDLRKHFTNLTTNENLGQLGASGDGILNVRVVRDKETHLGKGIAYIMFASKPLMRLAIEQKNGKNFMGRELRIKKAVSAVRLEKKKVRTAERLNLKMEEAALRAKLKNEENDELNQLKKLSDFQNQIESDDSDDEYRR